MARFLALTLTALLIFASTGAHRAVAAMVPHAPVVSEGGQSAKAPCCRGYKPIKTSARAACQLPPAVLDDAAITLACSAGHTTVDSRTDRVPGGQTLLPEKQPPRA